MSGAGRTSGNTGLCAAALSLTNALVAPSMSGKSDATAGAAAGFTVTTTGTAGLGTAGAAGAAGFGATGATGLGATGAGFGATTAGFGAGFGAATGTAHTIVVPLNASLYAACCPVSIRPPSGFMTVRNGIVFLPGYVLVCVVAMPKSASAARTPAVDVPALPARS